MPNLVKITPSNSAPRPSVLLHFEDGKEFTVPYLDLRFECPCASCVDEMTGKRTLKKERLDPNVRLKKVEPVGRYGVHFEWSDGHRTGMFHFDRLYEIGNQYPASS